MQILAKIIVVTSGKGGVGKTTTSAAFGTGLALRGQKTVIIDFDVGLRNLDLIMGCERRVVYDFVNVINGEAKLSQALIKDKHVDNLYILPASQTRDKDALTPEGVKEVLETLSKDFDYIVCDSPAGIERGAHMAMYHADSAIIVTNPEVSSVRDSGFNVYPSEVEEVLTSYPGIQEAVVIGVPSEATGETVKAFIIKKDPSLTTQQIIAYCHEHLAHYKTPKCIEFVAELPKSNVGKVLRRKLRGDEK